MNKRIVITAVIVAVVVTVAILYVGFMREGKELPTSSEYVGGKYNVTLSSFKDGHSEIRYTDENGLHSEMYFESQMKTGLDWIKDNTSENSTFLCWWDYGHSIKGYAERNVVNRNPSHEWIEMVASARTDPTAVKEFDSNEKLVDVAKALATSNNTETIQIMEKYGAKYIVVYKDDSLKAPWMYKVASLDPTDYQGQLQDSTWGFNDRGRQTMISRLLDDRDTGFTLVYQDTAMKIYTKD